MRSAGAEHVRMWQQPFRQAAATAAAATAAVGARSGRHRAAAGFVRGETTGAADHRPTPQVVLAVPTCAVSHLLKKH